MAKIKRLLGNKWGWITAIIFTLFGFIQSMSFLAVLGTGIAGIVSLPYFPLAGVAAVVSFIQGFILGLGLERIFGRAN